MRPFILLVLLSLLAGEDLPLGHAEFLPTPQRPVGLLGDGTGVFPGAEPPTSWDYRTGVNVRWSVRLPGGGQGSPIVVGKQLFVGTDPDLLLCYDAADGALLWQDRVTPLDLLPPAKAALLDSEWRELVAFRGGVHAVMNESYLLRYRLARIDAVRAGEAFSIARAGRGLFQHGRDVGGSPALAGHLTRAEEEALDEWARGVDDETVAALRARLAAVDATIERERYHSGNGYVHSNMPFSRNDGASAFLSTPEGERWQRRWTTLNRFGIMADANREWLGAAWPTPASDGEHLFVVFGTGQVACYTLDGRRLWLRQFRLVDPSIRGETVIYDRHCASPILSDQGVVVMHGHVADKSLGGRYRWLDLRCLDKATGAVRWQRRFDDRGGHDVPLHIRLRHGELDLIVTNMGPVFRSDDGREVVDLGITCCALPTLLDGGRVLLHDAQPGGGRGWPAVLARFAVDPAAPAGVACEVLWRGDLKGMQGMLRAGTTHHVSWRGHLLSATRSADAATLRHVAEWRIERSGSVDANVVVAGDRLIVQSLRGPCSVVDVADPAAARQIGTGLIGSSRMRRFLLDTGHGPEAVREECERGILLNNYHRLCTANPWLQGRRLYLRSMDDLFCIEDTGASVDPGADQRR